MLIIQSVRKLVKQNEQLKVENASARHQNGAITNRLGALEATISKMLDNRIGMPISGK
ncbi:hypothetical protein [Dyadobacter sp. MSC1_007]|uniref:hypothetical protein n=1 Tax=Dyadobacter sp. MSC1_007 TaxID=2909264 RepID=UPI002030E70C|nr:hypothetical protein [Dyadobacter sp. MSC1_007]